MLLNVCWTVKHKSIDNYRAFHEELETLPAPQMVKDAVKPKAVVKSETEAIEETQVEIQPSESEKKGFFAKGKYIAKKVGHSRCCCDGCSRNN